MKIEDLEENRLCFQLLRKPDFQRETASWSPEKIIDLVRSYLDGDLIPSIIIWWNAKNGKVVVIDGSHRLSALLAWVHDDYGDGEKICRPFFGRRYSARMEAFAKRTRELMQQEIGAYKDLKRFGINETDAPNEYTFAAPGTSGHIKLNFNGSPEMLRLLKTHSLRLMGIRQ